MQAHEDARPGVAVLGAGLLGHAIAQCFAAAGWPTLVYDVDRAAIEQARTRIESVAERMQVLGAWDAATAQRSTHCGYRSDLRDAVSGARLIVEAVPERLDLKRELFGAVEPLVDDTAVLASNSSSLAASAIGQALRKPDRLLNLHFFNPAQVMPLVEISPSPATDPSVTEAAEQWMAAIGKVPVVLRRETPGLVANRLQAALLREALSIVDNGIVTHEQLDTIVTHSFGRRLGQFGVFQIADIGGLDVFAALCQELFPHLDGTAQVPASLGRRVDEGRLGLKSEAGFYRYGNGQSPATRLFDVLAKSP